MSNDKFGIGVYREFDHYIDDPVVSRFHIPSTTESKLWRQEYIQSVFREMSKKLKESGTEFILVKSRQIGKSELKRQLYLRKDKYGKKT